MGAFEVICGILLVIASLIMIVTVLLQSSESNGMGAITGGAETFFGKNKSKSMEGKLALLTKICAVVFVVMSLALCILGK
ncbi:MAG: preprotein translocase subunit SecG [Clostridia bacterium]|nr:preprotein translocase subunit SecG [Clostridia bacterium]